MANPGSVPDHMPHKWVRWCDPSSWGFKDDPAERVLDVQKIKKRYRHFRSIKHGYTGLMLFLFFMCAYVFCLGRQHRASAIGKPNESLQTMFELLKADTKDKDSASVYNTLTKVVVPKLMTGAWENITGSGEKISGVTAFGYYHVIGGIVLTAVKGKSRECFRGNRCYAQAPIHEPEYTFKVPGQSVSFTVPYNSALNGYSVSLPGSASKETIAALVAGFKGLFGPDTRELRLHAVLFNPSGQKTITNVMYGATVDVDSTAHFSTKISTIPYHFYEPELLYFQLACELGTVAFALWAFVIPICQYVFKEPKPTLTDKLEKPPEGFQAADYRKKWVAWTHLWKHLPQKGGRPSLATPTVFYLGLFGGICFHIFIGMLYSKLGRFGNQEFDWLFVDPVAECTSISCMMSKSLEALEVRVLPFISVVEDLAVATTRYFFVHTLLLAVCVARLQQYFAFQKRLAIVTDTFSGIFDDLLHLGIVVLLTCFFFGVLNSLAFGAYDPPFRSFWTAFKDMVLVCFGMYKPSAGNPFILSMFKYTPHTLNSSEFMSWEPVLLQILFKTFVILLLFKLLMGVIMEGYKKHARLKNKATTVRQDLSELWEEFYQHCRARVFGTPHVSLFHIALAMSYLNRTRAEEYEEDGSVKVRKDKLGNVKDKPWEKYFVGLDHKHAIMDALNSVLPGGKHGTASDDPDHRGNMGPVGGAHDREQLSIHAKAKIDQYELKRCDEQDVDFVLRIFGTNRQRARVKFDQIWKEKCQAKEEKKKEKDAEEAKTKELKAFADAEVIRMSEKISKSRGLRLEKLASSARLEVQEAAKYEKELHHKVFSEEELKEIFNEYDITTIGSIDHRLFPQVFRQLGYSVPGKTLAHILADHDEDEDGDVDFKEFRLLMADDRLVGLYDPELAGVNTGGDSAKQATLTSTFSGSVTGQDSSKLTTPLLDEAGGP